MPALRTLSRTCALALPLLLAAAPLARSQTPPPGIPSKAEIEKQLKAAFEKIPDETSEIADVATLTYKPIPTDALTAIEDSGQQMPQGMNPENAAKQFGPMAKPYIEKYCGMLGKLEVKKELKTKSGKLAPGTYVIGLVMEELNPVGVTISGGSLKAPIQIPLKAVAQPAQPYKHFKCELRPGKADGELVIWVGFGPVDAATPKLTYAKK
jgi:hypothetical protein